MFHGATVIQPAQSNFYISALHVKAARIFSDVRKLADFYVLVETGGPQLRYSDAGTMTHRSFWHIPTGSGELIFENGEDQKEISIAWSHGTRKPACSGFLWPTKQPPLLRGLF